MWAYTKIKKNDATLAWVYLTAQPEFTSLIIIYVINMSTLITLFYGGSINNYYNSGFE